MKTIAIILSILSISCTVKIHADGSKEATIDGYQTLQIIQAIK